MSQSTILSTCAVAIVATLTACSSDDAANHGNGSPDGSIVASGSGGGSVGSSGASATAGQSGKGGARAGAGGTSPAAGGTGPGGASAGTGGGMSAGAGGPSVTYGQKYEGGQFHEGPVDWDETQWHNACAPSTKYAPAIRMAEGELLAGLWNGIPNVADYCDACISVTTAKGKSAILRVVTYGDTTTNSIDVSPAAYQILNSGEFPRSMTWQFTKCPDTGQIIYEFQTGSNEWWTSLWVRNARLPLKKVEVKSVNHASYAGLQRGSDGTLTDGGGFGNGPFSIRLTSIDDQVLEDAFTWPAGGIAGATLTGKGNFP
jgi:hypothetical protein